MTDRDKLIEAMARAICKRNWPSASVMDVAEMWDGWHGDAEAALAAIEAQGFAVVPGWQPIETAPRDGTAILGYFGDHIGEDACDQALVMWSDRGTFMLSEHPFDDVASPTHWMPLPAAPIQAARGGV